MVVGVFIIDWMASIVQWLFGSVVRGCSIVCVLRLVCLLGCLVVSFFVFWLFGVVACIRLVDCLNIGSFDI